ncbi:putative glycogen debranching enzyme [Dysgonomonas sp. PH5-45]|uniref:glycogen debranching enzyme N-terminal domain-containing protein n=1 Tax=unclassified Dysgonomonas TaxID=2630389 RepID=UPI00247441C4|nr:MULTISPECIES: glycogen debranching enzyme N-terminal domain-containing protein [unclassified Dysgonomonas]MDH6354285.1 putative glycogen debranching enzyme [Dysgonomonas sp. PH5-45]MDH6387186.1 putative glycogen debranching enzyme [Dysgonomonas sp. PH5-37]
MSYLKFDKTRMVNLEYSLDREILRANRKGAYHCTTLVECNTRKQHGLLVMPIPEIDDSNHVLLSSFDETIIQRGVEFNLGLHKYDGENYSPMGHKYIREFDCDSCPKTVYRIGGVILSKEKVFALKENSIMIRYRLLDAHSPTTIRFRPLLAFRSINDLTYENQWASQAYDVVENGISLSMYNGYPNIYMQFSKSNNFVFAPTWYKGVEYQKDQEDGFPYKEDLYSPGYFEMPIKKDETIVFSGSDSLVETKKLLESFKTETDRRTSRSSFLNCLTNSAHQFYFSPNADQLYIKSGYPWMGVSARIQFLTLPALTFGIGKPEAFERIMDTAIPSIKQFLSRKTVTNHHLKSLDTEPDALLWVVWSLMRYAKISPDVFKQKYADLVVRIFEFIRKNRHPELKVLENGLLYCDGRDKPISVMNAMIKDHPVTPRTGCLVEFNAIWYDLIMFNLDMASANGNSAQTRNLTALAETVRVSFLDTFLNTAGYLFDYVDGEYPNWSVRPNMLFALVLEHPLLTRRQSKFILDMVTKELLTPKGIRTLSPKSEGYQPYYTGDIDSRNYAFSNGVVWPAFLAPFVEAYIKVHQRSSISFIERLIIGLEEEMTNDCIGSLSQLYDGNPPYTGRGAISDATSVASVLRLMRLYADLEEEWAREYETEV